MVGGSSSSQLHKSAVILRWRRNPAAEFAEILSDPTAGDSVQSFLGAWDRRLHLLFCVQPKILPQIICVDFEVVYEERDGQNMSDEIVVLPLSQFAAKGYQQKLIERCNTTYPADENCFFILDAMKPCASIFVSISSFFGSFRPPPLIARRLA